MKKRGKFFDRIHQQYQQARRSIALPESTDPRVLEAASRLLEGDNSNRLALIGSRSSILEKAQSLGIALGRFANSSSIYWVSEEHPQIEQAVFEDINSYFTRKGRSIEQSRAKAWAHSKINQAAWLVGKGKIDCGVAGCTVATSDVILATITHIGIKEDQSLISGAFIMVKENDEDKAQYYAFADCGVVVTPTPVQLKDIAFATSLTFNKLFPDSESRLAFLSFSTEGSANHRLSKRMQLAYQLFHDAHPDICAFGEIQFDAAIEPKVSQTKCPNSPLKGAANCFIFPDLNSGNIAYKITQRLGGFKAFGPLLQGAKQPFNDLSRGASSEDIEMMIKLTAIQA